LGAWENFSKGNRWKESMCVLHAIFQKEITSFSYKKKSITEETQIINGTMKLAYCTGPYTIAVSNKGSETSGLRDRWTSF
jgi:hypothetical protein